MMGGTTFSRKFSARQFFQVNGVRMEFLGKNLVAEAYLALIPRIVASDNVGNGRGIGVVGVGKEAKPDFGLRFFHRETGKEVAAHLHAGFRGAGRNLEDRHIAAALIDVMLRGHHLNLRGRKAHGQVQVRLALPAAEKASPGIVEGVMWIVARPSFNSGTTSRPTSTFQLVALTGRADQNFHQ